MNHCNLTFEAMDWINGELLGDSSLEQRSPLSARFLHTSKYLEYACYIRDTLEGFGVERVGRIIKRLPTNFGDPVYTYGSRNYIELLPIRMYWYPEGKKVVPKYIKLTPVTCRQWYIGDGSFHERDKFIRLHTNAFPISDVEWLVRQLAEIGISASRQPNSNVIRIFCCSTKDFLNYIGNCPVSCYQYKWRYLKW